MQTRILCVLFSTVILFSSCNREAVNLDSTNAKGEVARLANFTFRFNKALVKDSMLNMWDSTDYVTFEPKIHGRFRWESPDQLVFSPAMPLAAATTYKAKVNKEVLRYSKYGKVDNGSDISFHTPDLTLDNMQVIWVEETEGSKKAVPQIDLFFNYLVNPKDVENKLSVKIGGEKMQLTPVTISPDNKVSFRINGLKAEDKDYSAKVEIDKGLKPGEGNNPTPEIISQQLTVPSPFNIAIQNVESQSDGDEGVITVTTSQELANESIKSFIKIEPAVPFTTEISQTGVVVRSDKFDTEKSYQISFLKGLRGKLGGTLKEDISQQVAFGQLEASISFTNNKAVYLSKKGSGNIEVRITSVPKIKLVISKVYENNLIMSQRYGYYPQETRASQASYSEDGEYYDYYDDYGSSATMGDVIYEKEIDTRTLPRSGGGRMLNLKEFEDRLPDFKGIYHVMIRSTDDYWVKDSRFISMSDLGLIAKEGFDKIFVFANSIKSAEAVNGVNILVYGSNNQLIGSGNTNADGVAEIAYTKKDFSGFHPAMIIAKTDNDFNYLPFNSTSVNTSRFDVGGKRNNPTGMDAFVYAERDIYRPGEKVNFSVILRDREWKSPGDIPLKMKFLMPNGKELKSFRKNLNEEGSLEGNIDLSTSAITGSYTLEVYTSNDILLSAKNFSVEEFVPDRIKVKAELDKTSVRSGETTNLSVSATNFFGPPAANRNYEVDIQVRRKYFSPEKFPEYNFSLSDKNMSFDNDLKTGKTDDNGNINVSYTLPEQYKNSGLLQASFYTTVFDETGRPVSRSSSLDLFTQDVLMGIKYDGYYYQPLNQPAKFMLAAVNKDGNGVNAKAKVQVVKHEYRTNLVKSGSYFRYESSREDKLMIENSVSVNSETAYTYIPRSPGDYEVKVYSPGSDNYVSQSFYSYGSWGMTNTSFEVNTEGHIDIALDKKKYSTGESATVLFKTPFNGRLLITTETDKVVSYQYVNTENRTANITLPLKAEHLPNVYITATLIKPHEVSDIPLTVAHGFESIKVDDKSRKIPVEIIAKKEVRSRTSQSIKVKAEPGSFVTLSAVDNGVLQVSDFKTPDPYDYFYQKRALQVSAYDMYPLLFPEIRGKLSSTGGDAEAEMDKRVNPMPAKRVKIVSYWSGIAKANGSGVAEFNVNIPQFSGEVRLMAVAYKGQQFGAAENTMIVADPIVISTALPRFLSPGDTVDVAVTMTKTTDKSANAGAVLSTEGPIKVIGGGKQSVSLGGKKEGMAAFRIVADPTISTGKIKVAVNAMGETFTEETEISIRPPSTLQKVTGSGSIAGGSSKKLNLAVTDFIPSSVDYNLVVSRSPVMELGKQLNYLVQYPYGCTEQTVSAAFPQLYFSDLSDLIGFNKQTNMNANSNVLEAIRKIKMRQLYNGAVTLWDGEGEAHWWSTVYSAHFLLEAKKAGFDVDNGLLQTMLTYINNRLKNKETISYYYNRDQNKKIAPKEVPYSLYVLALAGKTNVPSMNYYKSNPDLLALDGKYLLSAAYAAAGDKKSFNAMLPAAFSGEESVQQSGGSFYSYVRDEAISLNALVDVDPGNAQIGIMAKHVGDKLKSDEWLNTQERAFSFLALGKIAKKANQSTATAEIKIDGKTIAKVDNGQWKGSRKDLKGTNVEIVTSGSGQLYYFWEAEGISSTGAYKEEDNFLKVRRQFYTRTGSPINGNTFKQNDLVVIGITLEKSYSGTIENVVITDLLPAGFEIENPRTKDIPGMEWIKNASTPTALDVRDDRIHFFVDLYNQKQIYYYAVRAVSPGTYKQGPVSADAMYNGEYHSYHGAGVVRVVQ